MKKISNRLRREIFVNTQGNLIYFQYQEPQTAW